MTLDVWKDPGVISLLGEIKVLAKRSEVDKFFWLKAVAARNKAPGAASHELKFFNAAAQHGAKPPRNAIAPADKVYRIANIVLQGGGVLGIAHAGFVAGLESADVRFAGIAGASAGAIMAMGMTAVRGDDLLNETHKDVVDIVNAMPMSAFIDGPYRTRRLIKQFLLKRQSFSPSSWPALLGALRQILQTRGLNPGNAFEDWVRGVLAERGLRTVDDLFARLKTISIQLNAAIDAVKKLGKQPLSSLEPVEDEGRHLLQVMAACTPIGVKFQFPEDVRYLSGETSSNSPAALVRASMSIPFFFGPATFGVNKTNWKSFIDSKFGGLAGKDRLDEFRSIDEVAFLDGGMFSNLPVDAFSAIFPDVPTIAVPLMNATPARPYRRRSRLSSLAADIGTVAFMVRDQRDRDAIAVLERRRQVFERRQIQAGLTMPAKFPFRLAAINVQDANWLNFAMDERDQRDLFVMGLERARDFLEQDLGGSNG
ncbi:patatin-like phospholipase family protein [Mesorhizobium sp. 43Arga]